MLTERERQQLRQEQDAFDLRRGQAQRWDKLCLLMCYAGIGALILFAAIAGYVSLHPQAYDSRVAAPLVTLAGIGAMIFRIVLTRGSTVTLEPVTRDRPKTGVPAVEPPETRQATSTTT